MLRVDRGNLWILIKNVEFVQPRRNPWVFPRIGKTWLTWISRFLILSLQKRINVLQLLVWLTIWQIFNEAELCWQLNVTNKLLFERRLSSRLSTVMFRGTPCRRISYFVKFSMVRHQTWKFAVTFILVRISITSELAYK